MTRQRSLRHPRHSRILLTAAGIAAILLVAVWGAPRASGAAAAWIHTSPVQLRTQHAPGDGRIAVGALGRSSGAPVTFDAGATFSLAAVVSDVPPAESITVHLRVSQDGHAWGQWFAAPLEVVDENGEAQAYTEPIWTGPARYAQVRVAGDGRRAPASLSGVRLVTIDPTGGSGLVARVAGAARRVAATVTGIDLAETASAASTAPAIVTRSQWGADERLRSGSPSFAPVKLAFIHHTDSGNSYSQADAPGIVRAIYAFHTDPKGLGWSDIGYNFLIDRYGTIYEGRYGGIARGVIGAQAGGFNTGSTGIAVMGTFTDTAPPAAAITSLERLLAWKLGVTGLDPKGSAVLTCGLTDRFKKGATVTFPVIAGHRQANYTECPGDAFYALLPAIRTDVAKRMGEGGGGGGGGTLTASLSASKALLSPNGDGSLDTVGFTVALSAPADWRIAVKDADGETLGGWSGQGASASLTWDGKFGGRVVPDGVYTVNLSATTTAGGSGSASAQIAVDTTAPRLATAAATPPTFSPNGDGRDETAVVTYRPAEACSVRVGILATSGDVVRWLHGWQARQEQTYKVTWDGRVSSGGKLVAATDGQYRFVIERRDGAGNVARQGIKVLLDRTLGFPAAGPTSFSPNGDGAFDTTKLGFRLTLKATVTIRVLVDDQVVRTLSLGSLPAGKHSAVWDGRVTSGDALTSCRPTFTVTAVSTIGESSVSRALVLDLSQPRITAGSAKTTSAGVATKLSYKITDAFSTKADATWTVTDSKGRRVASTHAGKLATGRTLTAKWKPKARGAYTVTFRATDLAGNPEEAPASTKVTVR